MTRSSNSDVHVCRFAGCSRTFAQRESLEVHEREHEIRRKQVAHDRILEAWGLPGPACLLCKQFARDTATSYLHVRLQDVERLLPSCKIHALLPILDAHSNDVIRSVRKVTTYWSFERCVDAKREVHRIMNKLVTLANGRGHPDNKMMRLAVTQELDDLLFLVLGNWWHRGLRHA